MTTAPAKLSVLVGERFACIKIAGRANLSATIDFKALIDGLEKKGYGYFVLDLSECLLMDSTFLGTLAGFGLKYRKQDPETCKRRIELLNPSPRIAELLENLCVLDLFAVRQGEVALTDHCSAFSTESTTPGKEETIKACLEAHETLMSLSPGNVAKFKDVAQFLADDLKRLKSPQAS